MKILIQWSRRNPQDWETYDSSQWHTLPFKPEPAGGERIDDTPGWIHEINIQGNTFSADHYAVENLPGGACRVYAWNQDLDDHPQDTHYGFVYTILPLAPDPRFGGAYNTRISREVYANPAVAHLFPDNIHPWADFPYPPTNLIRHGTWVPDALNDRHRQVLTPHGWREWIDLVPKDMVDGGKVIDQRSLGRYDKPLGTKTLYAYSTARATGVHVGVAGNEFAFEDTPISATSDTYTAPAASDALAWIFTSPSGFPDNSAWPTGNYRFQIDATIVDSNMNFGLLTLGGSAGHFARVDSGLTSDLETKAQVEAAFTSAGLHLATTGSVSWAAGSSTDRFECVLVVQNTNGHNTRDITLQLSEADDFADGPWPTASPSFATPTPVPLDWFTEIPAVFATSRSVPSPALVGWQICPCSEYSTFIVEPDRGVG